MQFAIFFLLFILSACNSFTVYENKGNMNFSNNTFDEHNTNHYHPNGQKDSYPNPEEAKTSNYEDVDDREAKYKGNGLYVNNNNGFINMASLDKPHQSIGTGQNIRRSRESKEEKIGHHHHHHLSNETDHEVHILHETISEFEDKKVNKVTGSSEIELTTNKNAEIDDLNKSVETTPFNDETELVIETTTVKSIALEIENMQSAFVRPVKKGGRGKGKI